MWNIQITASTRKGAGHSILQGNQDRFLVLCPLSGDTIIDKIDYKHTLSIKTIDELSLLAAVSDGISSTKNAGEAAQKTIKTLCTLFQNNVEVSRWCSQINAHIRRDFFSWSTGESCGAATLSFLLFANGYVQPVNVGDSPIYLLRGGKLHALYEKQTILVQDDFGRKYYAIEKYMGNPNCIKIPQEYMGQPIALQSGDVFLICSDGISDGLGVEKLVKLMSKENVTAEKLRAKAKKKQKDDVTAVLIKVSNNVSD